MVLTRRCATTPSSRAAAPQVALVPIRLGFQRGLSFPVRCFPPKGPPLIGLTDDVLAQRVAARDPLYFAQTLVSAYLQRTSTPKTAMEQAPARILACFLSHYIFSRLIKNSTAARENEPRLSRSLFAATCSGRHHETKRRGSAVRAGGDASRRSPAARSHRSAPALHFILATTVRLRTIFGRVIVCKRFSER